MTVKEVIEELQKFPPDANVFYTDNGGTFQRLVVSKVNEESTLMDLIMGDRDPDEFAIMVASVNAVQSEL